MSPRKTRRGAKADGANQTLSESKLSDSPSSQRTMKTRRQLSKTISTESEADQSPVMNKSRRKMVQETPTDKVTRSRKKQPLTEITIDDSSSALDVTVGAKKRTRKAKDNEIPTEPTGLVHSSLINDSQAEKPRENRTRKRALKKDDSKSEDETANVATNKTSNAKITTSPGAGVLDEDAPMSKEDTEVQQASVRSSRNRGSNVATPSPRSAVKRRGRTVKSKNENFTPESSPIAIALSPHRTKKTPRKSPMNLGSPKSHAEQSLRLSKTPRKLPVVEESPAPSEKSISWSLQGTPEKSSNRLSFGDETGSIETGSAKKKKVRVAKRSSSGKKSHKSPSSDVPVRKFSKSPKIVLKTPRGKSSKIKSPRVVSTKLKVSPSPKRLSKSPLKSKRTPSPRKSVNLDKSARSPISRISRGKKFSPNRSVNSPKKSSIEKSNIDDEHKSPTVRLDKMPSSGIVTPETTTRSSSRRSNNASIHDTSNTTPIRTPSAEKRASQGGESPRRLKSAVKKRTPITDSGTPLRPAPSPLVSVTKRSIRKSMIISSSNCTPIDLAKGKTGSAELVKMSSSTPRERIRRSLNLSPGLGGTPIANSPLNVPQPTGSSTFIDLPRTTRSSRIEDITNPLISEDDESFSLNSSKKEETAMDDTFEIVKKPMMTMEEEDEAQAKDGTYELAEPKTPVLRRQAAKRSFVEVDTSVDEKTAKRTCRVRFASPPPNSADKKVNVVAPIGRSKSATPGKRISERRTGAMSNVTLRAMEDQKLRRRSNSMTSVPLVKTPLMEAKRRSNSVSDANVRSASRTAQNESVNRLSKPRLSIHSTKKPEIKTLSAKKAPNFAQIHQRKFAKMESLVDAKKRVEKRHLAMNSQIPTSLSRVNTAARSKAVPPPKATDPNVPVNGAYNRYGFKLRKNDAIKIMTQKQPPHTSEKKLNESRMTLKGVRTNRRFELIMKARNLKP